MEVKQLVGILARLFTDAERRDRIVYLNRHIAQTCRELRGETVYTVIPGCPATPWTHRCEYPALHDGHAAEAIGR